MVFLLIVRNRIYQNSFEQLWIGLFFIKKNRIWNQESEHFYYVRTLGIFNNFVGNNRASSGYAAVFRFFWIIL